MTLDISGVATPPTESPAPVERPSISVLGIRRRYWEMTHGWTVPTSQSETPETATPGRVA